MTVQTRALRYLAEVLVSNVDKKSVEGEQQVRLCNYTDVYYQTKITDGLDFMPASARSAQIARFGLRAGDSVLTKDSETASDIAVPAYVPEDLPGVVCGYHLALIRPRRSAIDPAFLGWALQADFMREQFAARASGVTRYGLTYEAIQGAQVPTAMTPDEQRRIADFLDDQVTRIDAAIHVRTNQVNLTAERFQTELDREVDALGHDCGWTLLRRLAMGIEQGWSPPCESTPAPPGEPGVLKLGAVRRGRFWGGENKAFLPGVRPDAAWRVRDGDLLVSRANTPQLVGEAAVVQGCGEECDLHLCDLLYRLKLAPGIDPWFVAACLRTRRSRDFCRVVARGTSDSMVKLRGEDILNIPLPRATSAAMAAVAQTSRKALDDVDHIEKLLLRSIELLRERRESLITASVTGEFDVSSAGPRAAAAVMA